MLVYRSVSGCLAERVHVSKRRSRPNDPYDLAEAAWKLWANDVWKNGAFPEDSQVEFQRLNNGQNWVHHSMSWKSWRFEIPKITCWRFEPSWGKETGPLTDLVIFQQNSGNGAGAMFQGWDAKGSGSGLFYAREFGLHRWAWGWLDEGEKLIHKEMRQVQLKNSRMKQIYNSMGSFWYHNFDLTLNWHFESRIGRFGDGGKMGYVILIVWRIDCTSQEGCEWCIR